MIPAEVGRCQKAVTAPSLFTQENREACEAVHKHVRQMKKSTADSATVQPYPLSTSSTGAGRSVSTGMVMILRFNYLTKSRLGFILFSRIIIFMIGLLITCSMIRSVCPIFAFRVQTLFSIIVRISGTPFFFDLDDFGRLSAIIKRFLGEVLFKSRSSQNSTELAHDFFHLPLVVVHAQGDSNRAASIRFRHTDGPYHMRKCFPL